MVQLLRIPKLLISTVLLLSSLIDAARVQSYPKPDLQISKLETYTKSQELPIRCISRHIDNGEHKFDENGNIIYQDFPKCTNINKPLSFKYGTDEDIVCNLKFDDELYHLFQLYLHQDSPFTCQLEMLPGADELNIPLNFNFRGIVDESHFDIDKDLNVFLVGDYNEGLVVSGSGFSSSLNTTKVIIGDNVELRFNVRWLDVSPELKPIGEATDGKNEVFYRVGKIGTSTFVLVSYCLFFGVVGFILSLVLSYKRLSKKIQLNELSKVD